MAEVAIMEEDVGRAKALLAESRTIGQKTTLDEGTTVWTLNHQGHIAQLCGDYDRAVQLHQESLPLFLKNGDNWLHYYAYHDLGQTALGQGDVEAATQWLGQALTISRSRDDVARVVWCLAGLGCASALNEEPRRATRLWGAAEQLRESIGCRPAPATRATYERAVAMTRAQLTEQAFATLWAEGRTMTLEQAIAYALGVS